MSSTQDHNEAVNRAGDRGAEREDWYSSVWRSEEFRDLRRRYRRFVLPVTAISLLWYFLYVFLAAYAADFMGRKVFSEITIGLIFGLLQFVTTFGVTALYIRYAERVLDPITARIRERMDAGGMR